MRRRRWQASAFLLIAVVAAGCAPAGSSPVQPPPTVTPSASPAALDSSPEPTIDGGRIAEAAVAAFAADPFVAHIDLVGEVTSGGTTVALSASGDFDGPDMRVAMQGTTAGTVVPLELVMIGDDVWMRAGDQQVTTTRAALPAEQARAMEAMFRIVADPGDLRYAGVETVDGQPLHHLAAAPGVIEYSDSNTTGVYDAFDLYVLDDGTPVLVRGAFSGTNDSGATGTGMIEMRFSSVGGPVTIEPLAESSVSPRATASPLPSPPVDQAKVSDLLARHQAHPRDLDVLIALSDEYYAAEQYEMSATWLDKLLAIDPKHIDGLLARGAVYFNLGDTASAKSSWKKVVKIDPKNVEAHYDLGFLYLSQTIPDYAGLQREWETVVALDPTSELAKTVQGHLDSLAAASMLP
jgi:Tfp pilus assembly protein PilF